MIQEGDKVLILNAGIIEPVYVLGVSPLTGECGPGTVYVVGDLDGNGLPVHEHDLRLMERSDITKARARRLRVALINWLITPHLFINL